MKQIAIIVPCYNEEDVLNETIKRLSEEIEVIEKREDIDAVRIVFVNDGSKDRTWDIIAQHAATNPHISGICLAHNVGHQQALWAGLEWAATNVDAAITIDADLQDDVTAITQMVELYCKGIDVVYGVRKERKTDTWFKRTTAQSFYKLMQSMGCNVVYNHADFRLMSQRAMQALMAYPERNLFLRGMVASLGFATAMVYYDRAERFAGQSKYPLHKMMSFAADGITSFSVRPLQYISFLGLACMLISICAIVYGIAMYIEGKAIVGWTSQLVSIWFIGGAILLACGIIGEYVGKIYTDVKRRPRYFIDKTIGL